MEQIVKKGHYDFSQYTGLSPMDKKIIKASNSFPVVNPVKKDFGKKELATVLVPCIEDAILILGHKHINSKDVSKIVVEVTNYIFDNMHRVKIDEVITAIKQGAFGTYKKEKDVVFVSATNIISWIKSYLLEKHKSMKKIQDQDSEKLEGIRVKEKEKLSKFYFMIYLPYKIEEDRLLYIDTGCTQWISWLYYDKLTEFGFIDIDNETKKHYYNDALLIAKNENIKKNGVFEKFIKNASIEKEAVQIAKRMALEKWYSEQKGDVSKIIIDKIEKI